MLPYTLIENTGIINAQRPPGGGLLKCRKFVWDVSVVKQLGCIFLQALVGQSNEEYEEIQRKPEVCVQRVAILSPGDKSEFGKDFYHYA